MCRGHGVLQRGERLCCDGFDPKIGRPLAGLKCRMPIVLMICCYRRPGCKPPIRRRVCKVSGAGEPRPLPMSGAHIASTHR
jgi:hypothetical protein